MFLETFRAVLYQTMMRMSKTRWLTSIIYLDKHLLANNIDAMLILLYTVVFASPAHRTIRMKFSTDKLDKWIERICSNF